MGYFNTDAGEQRQRASIIDRRVELHERYGSKKPLDATHLADDFDRNLRARHDEFLDEVKPINVSWESPGFAALSTPALLAEVTEKVRSTRQTDHATARMGTVETSAGTIYWTIEKLSLIHI